MTKINKAGKRRLFVGSGLAVATVLAVSACSGNQLASSGITTDNAYQIGCPALDSTLATGSVANRAVVAGLKGLRDRTDRSTDTRKWLDSAVSVLQSGGTKDLPRSARTTIVDGCRTHGYTLQNLK